MREPACVLTISKDGGRHNLNLQRERMSQNWCCVRTFSLVAWTKKSKRCSLQFTLFFCVRGLVCLRSQFAASGAHIKSSCLTFSPRKVIYFGLKCFPRARQQINIFTPDFAWICTLDELLWLFCCIGIEVVALKNSDGQPGTAGCAACWCRPPLGCFHFPCKSQI